MERHRQDDITGLSCPYSPFFLIYDRFCAAKPPAQAPAQAAAGPRKVATYWPSGEGTAPRSPAEPAKTAVKIAATRLWTWIFL